MFEKRPFIGCTTYHLTQSSSQREIVGLMPAYIEAIIMAGGNPFLIPHGLDNQALQATLDRLDGLLLPGGGDIAPQRYRGSDHPKIYGIDEERDRLEFWLAQNAVKQQKPLFAICRGHQLLNVALGGTLWSDVDSQRDPSFRHNYFVGMPRTYLAHTVQVAPDSTLSSLLGGTEVSVNSLHHQGVKKLADELTQTAVSADGLVESSEVKGHPFAVSVQWHPENLVHDHPEMVSLFRGFIDAARQTK